MCVSNRMSKTLYGVCLQLFACKIHLVETWFYSNILADVTDRVSPWYHPKQSSLDQIIIKHRNGQYIEAYIE